MARERARLAAESDREGLAARAGSSILQVNGHLDGRAGVDRVWLVVNVGDGAVVLTTSVKTDGRRPRQVRSAKNCAKADRRVPLVDRRRAVPSCRRVVRAHW